MAEGAGQGRRPEDAPGLPARAFQRLSRAGEFANRAAWVRAKGGTMPTPGKASDKVIPQPGADTSAAKNAEGNAADAATGPTENVTVAAPTAPQGATQNPAGAGNAGQ